MPLEVSLTIEKTDLLLGEQVTCRLQLANHGATVVTIPDPRSGGSPTYRLVELKTGAELLARGAGDPEAPPEALTIPAGGSKEVTLSLLRDVTWPGPAEYAVSAFVEYATDSGPVRAESKPVKVKVRPLAARHVTLDYAQGDEITAAYINPAGDPPDVVLSRFAIRPGGGMQTVEPVGKASLTSQPLKSVPPNTQSGVGEWVVWMEEDVLRFVQWTWYDRSGVEGKLKVPGGEGEVIAWPCIEPSAPNVERGNGAVLLWTSDARGGEATLHVVQLQASGRSAKARVETSVAFGSPRPRWSMSCALSDGSRRLVGLRPADGKLELFAMPWPTGKTIVRPPALLRWEGQFCQAGATVRSDDELRGAVLIWTGKGDDRKLELIGWTIAADGKTAEHFRQTVPWASSVPIARAIVKVRITGMPSVLLHKQDTGWVLYDAFTHLTEVPEPYDKTKLPLDFVFYGVRDVLLICAKLTGGFVVKRMDGSDLPPVSR